MDNCPAFPVKHFLRYLRGGRPCLKNYHTAMRACKRDGVVRCDVYLAEVLVAIDLHGSVPGVYVQTDNDEKIVIPLKIDDDGDVEGIR